MFVFISIIVCCALLLHCKVVDGESVLLKGSPPGMKEEQCFNAYAGYLPVGNEKSLFHMYIEATSEPEKKPWVLWLNGGPLCSSFGGLFTELGPYVIDKEMTVSTNPYAWNKVANMLFVEQPAGVGFSYPMGATNDTITAEDTYEALIAFLADHPELKDRPFYIAGESYGGHYGTYELTSYLTRSELFSRHLNAYMTRSNSPKHSGRNRSR